MDCNGRLFALRIPVWSEAVRREVMGPFISWKSFWNQRKKRCTRFWQKKEGLSKYSAMLVKMDCGIKIQHNAQTTFVFLGLGLDPNGINEKVLLLLYVSIQWFLFKPSDRCFLFLLCTAGSFCPWWKLLTWLTCWNKREISPCLPQAIRLLLVWLTGIWPCWNVSLPDGYPNGCFYLLVFQPLMLLLDSCTKLNK